MAAGEAVGTELAGYRIEALLGRGGMGVVYRAHDLALDRSVALKLLAPELAGDVRFRERFLRESRLAAALDHPAIVPIYDAGEVGGRLYIAMRLVDGTDLKRLLADEGPLEPGRALALLEQVADALDAAHERGLVHRDVKPSNVLVDARGHCYLADFGLSRRLADQTPRPGGARSLGTVDYVAPEQIRGETLDGRADLYSLGCLLYECIAGRAPFAGASDTAVVFAHLEQPPPTLPGLDAVVAKALAKRPQDRFPSGRALVEAARDALRDRRGPRLRRLLTTALVLAAGGTAIAVMTTRGTESANRAAPLLPLEENTLNVVDARARRLLGAVDAAGFRPTTHAPSDIAFLGGDVWVSVPGEHRLLRVDAATRRVTAVVDLPWGQADRIAAGDGMVWVREARNLGTRLFGIDARAAKVTRRFTKGGSSSGIAYGGGSLWLVGGANVIRVDPITGRTLRRIPAPAEVLAYGGGAVWAASEAGEVWKIDPVENVIAAHARLHTTLTDLAAGGGFVWAAIAGQNAIFKLSENDLSVQDVFPSGGDPERVATGGGYIWIANTAAETVSFVGQRSGRRSSFATAADPTTVSFHRGRLWTGTAAHLPELPPVSLELRISLPRKLINVDPEQRVFPMDEQLSYATCANLLTFAENGSLRPEIAAAMPTVSNGGRTYTFHIRPGFRFSPPSTEQVTAETFEHTIERTMGRKAQRPWDYLPDIVGERAYATGRARHISGIRAAGSKLTITLLRPAGDFLTRLSLPVFCPVPLSTPLDPRRTPQPIPSTGPYYIASIEPHRTVLLRNPSYTGSRAHRAARIVISDNIPTPTAVRLVNRGALDYLPPDFSADALAPGGELDRRYGPASAAARAGRQRYHRHDRPLLDTIVFNTQRPLFRSARLRRAVGYAIDRAALAKAYFDGPAVRVVPTAVPGFDAPGVYPITKPDLETAKRLAGRTRRRAVLLAPCDPGVVPAALVLRADLAKIGIAVHVEALDACDSATVGARFRQADMIIGTNILRGPPERDPVAYFDDALDHGGYQGAPLGPGPWHAPSFRRRLDAARALRGAARVRAFRRLDDELSRQAPLLVYGAFQYNEFFSARIGCKVFHSFYEFVDLGALCVTSG